MEKMAPLIRYLKQHFVYSDDFAIETMETNGGHVTLPEGLVTPNFLVAALTPIQPLSIS